MDNFVTIADRLRHFENQLRAYDQKHEENDREVERQGGIDRVREKAQKSVAGRIIPIVIGALVPAIKQQIAMAMVEMLTLLKQIDERVSLVEARAVPTFEGIYQDDRDYERAQLVTHQGSLWHANFKTRGVKPGDSRVWTLVCKRGRDGKDANRI